MKKTLLVLVSSLILSASAFSADTFTVTGAKAKSLLSIIQAGGAQNLATVGSLNVGVKDVHCSSSMTIGGPLPSQRVCHMVDKFSGADLTITGAEAKKLFSLLEKIGVTPTNVPDASFIEATTISCTKTVTFRAKPKCVVAE